MNLNEKVSVACASIEAVLSCEFRAKEKLILYRHLMHLALYTYEVGFNEGKYEKELAEWSEQVREEVEAIFLEEFLTTEAMDKFLDDLEDIE